MPFERVESKEPLMFPLPPGHDVRITVREQKRMKEERKVVKMTRTTQEPRSQLARSHQLPCIVP